MQWTGGAGRLTDLPARPFLLHPGDGLPHTDALDLPPWVQGVGVMLVVAVGAWLVADAWAERRAAGAADQAANAADPGERRKGERLVRGGPGAPEAAADDALSPTASPLPPETVMEAARLRGQPAAIEGGATFTPPRVLLFVLAVVAGWLALDRARAVEAVAAFIGNDGTARAATFAFAFAALFWVGGALTLVAPRGAALAFALAGACGFALATASRWEERLEWWGAGAAAEQWDGLAWWTAAAFGFALLALAAGRNRPSRRRFQMRSLPSGEE